MTKEPGTIVFRYLIDVWFDRLWKPVNQDAKTKKQNDITVSELERLELIRNLKEEQRVKKFSRTEVAIEDFSLRAL